MEVAATKAPTRWWGELDENRLRVWRTSKPAVPFAECARRLGRTFGATVNKAKLMGLTRPKRRFDGRVRRLHAEGQTVKEIVQRLRAPLTTVVTIHRRYGLKPNVRYSRREGGAKGIATASYRVGQPLIEYRHERERIGAFLAGWPAASNGVRRVLEWIEANGPVTARGYALATGRTASAAFELLRKKAAAGHLVTERVRPGGPMRFDIAPAVRERRRLTVLYQSGRIPE